MAKKHDVIIVGMGLASLAAAARLNELGVKDIGIYTTAYGGTPYIAAINFVLPDNPYGDTIGQYNDDMIHAGYGGQHHGGVQAPSPLGRGIRKE